MRLVQHLVRVIELSEMCYDGSIVESYEKLPYGTATKPAEITRSQDGEYFAYESDRTGLLLMWGTDYDLIECLDAFGSRFRTREQGLMLSAELLTMDMSVSDEVVHDVETRSQSAEGPFDVVREQVAALVGSVAVARFDAGKLEFSWKAPHHPFDDMDTVSSEVQLFSEDLDLHSALAMANHVGPAELLAAAQCTIDIRRRGRRRLVHFYGRQE